MNLKHTPLKFNIWLMALAAFFILAAADGCKQKSPSTPLIPGVIATPDLFEPDNNPAAAKAISVDGTKQYHNLYDPCDYDYVTFTAAADMQYDIETTNLESGADTYMYLIDTGGVNVIITDDDGGTEARASRIIWVCPADGVYFVRVQQYDCKRIYGEKTGYKISVRQGAPYTPTASPTITMTHTASPYVTDTPIETITPTFTETMYVTATPTSTVTPLPNLGADLWHAVNDTDLNVPAGYANAGVSATMMWYADGAKGTYDTGAANRGEFITAYFHINTGDKLYFWSYEHTENLAGYDTRKIFISAEGSPNWAQLTELFGTEQVWYNAAIPIPPQFEGLNARFRFVFDTVDRYNNGFPGWFVDDIFLGP